MDEREMDSTEEKGEVTRCAISWCHNEGVKDVLVPMVIDKQVAKVEATYGGQKWNIPSVVRRASGPMVVKKILARMCEKHAPDWEPAPEV
jgi:hypothetical protein